MNLRKIIVLSALALTGLSLARAADLAGKWTSEFDSPIGVQKYSYDFKVEADKITGKAAFDHSMGKGESTLKDIKLAKDDVSFVELANIGGNELAITYTGKISGDEIKLTRVVGDYGTEQIVAKRVKPEAKPETKPAPAK